MKKEKGILERGERLAKKKKRKMVSPLWFSISNERKKRTGKM